MWCTQYFNKYVISTEKMAIKFQKDRKGIYYICDLHYYKMDKGNVIRGSYINGFIQIAFRVKKPNAVRYHFF